VVVDIVIVYMLEHEEDDINYLHSGHRRRRNTYFISLHTAIMNDPGENISSNQAMYILI